MDNDICISTSWVGKVCVEGQVEREVLPLCFCLLISNVVLGSLHGFDE